MNTSQKKFRIPDKNCQIGNRKYLSSEILKDGRAVDSGSGSNPSRGECSALEVAMDPESLGVMH